MHSKSVNKPQKVSSLVLLFHFKLSFKPFLNIHQVSLSTASKVIEQYRKTNDTKTASNEPNIFSGHPTAVDAINETREEETEDGNCDQRNHHNYEKFEMKKNEAEPQNEIGWPAPIPIVDKERAEKPLSNCNYVGNARERT
jgi:hypothetical protein